VLLFFFSTTQAELRAVLQAQISEALSAPEVTLFGGCQPLLTWAEAADIEQLLHQPPAPPQLLQELSRAGAWLQAVNGCSNNVTAGLLLLDLSAVRGQAIPTISKAAGYVLQAARQWAHQ
jgi:hypothetical protein